MKQNYRKILISLMVIVLLFNLSITGLADDYELRGVIPVVLTNNEETELDIVYMLNVGGEAYISIEDVLVLSGMQEYRIEDELVIYSRQVNQLVGNNPDAYSNSTIEIPVEFINAVHDDIIYVPLKATFDSLRVRYYQNAEYLYLDQNEHFIEEILYSYFNEVSQMMLVNNNELTVNNNIYLWNLIVCNPLYNAYLEGNSQISENEYNNVIFSILSENINTDELNQEMNQEIAMLNHMEISKWCSTYGYDESVIEDSLEILDNELTIEWDESTRLEFVIRSISTLNAAYSIIDGMNALSLDIGNAGNGLCSSANEIIEIMSNKNALLEELISQFAVLNNNMGADATSCLFPSITDAKSIICSQLSEELEIGDVSSSDINDFIVCEIQDAVNTNTMDLCTLQEQDNEWLNAIRNNALMIIQSYAYYLSFNNIEAPTWLNNAMCQYGMLNSIELTSVVDNLSINMYDESLINPTLYTEEEIIVAADLITKRSIGYRLHHMRDIPSDNLLIVEEDFNSDGLIDMYLESADGFYCCTVISSGNNYYVYENIPGQCTYRLFYSNDYDEYYIGVTAVTASGACEVLSLRNEDLYETEFSGGYGYDENLQTSYYHAFFRGEQINLYDYSTCVDFYNGTVIEGQPLNINQIEISISNTAILDIAEELLQHRALDRRIYSNIEIADFNGDGVQDCSLLFDIDSIKVSLLSSENGIIVTYEDVSSQNLISEYEYELPVSMEQISSNAFLKIEENSNESILNYNFDGGTQQPYTSIFDTETSVIINYGFTCNSVDYEVCSEHTYRWERIEWVPRELDVVDESASLRDEFFDVITNELILRGYENPTIENYSVYEDSVSCYCTGYRVDGYLYCYSSWIYLHYDLENNLIEDCYESIWWAADAYVEGVWEGQTPTSFYDNYGGECHYNYSINIAEFDGDNGLITYEVIIEEIDNSSGEIITHTSNGMMTSEVYHHSNFPYYDDGTESDVCADFDGFTVSFVCNRGCTHHIDIWGGDDVTLYDNGYLYCDGDVFNRFDFSDEQYWLSSGYVNGTPISTGSGVAVDGYFLEQV